MTTDREAAMPDGGEAMDCAAMRAHLQEFLDGELTPTRAAALETHLAKCAHCFEEARVERRFLEALGAAREGTGCPEALRARVVGLLRAEGWEGAGPAGARPGPAAG